MRNHVFDAAAAVLLSISTTQAVAATFSLADVSPDVQTLDLSAGGIDLNITAGAFETNDDFRLMSLEVFEIPLAGGVAAIPCRHCRARCCETP